MTIEELLKYNDEDFIKFISKYDDFVTNKKVINRLINMKVGSFNSFLSTATSNTLNYIILQEQELLESEPSTFRIFYTRVNSETKRSVINNDRLLKKMVSIPKNSLGKNLIDISDTGLIIDILKKKYILDQVNTDIYFDTLKHLNDEEFEYVIEHLNSTNFISNMDNLENYLEGKFNLKSRDKSFSELATKKFADNFKLTHYLLKIKSYEQLYIFINFGIFIKFEMQGKLITFKDGTTIPFKTIEKVNKKHIASLIEEYQEMDNTGEKYQILINSIKMYLLFGFDGAKKIANNFFSNMTTKSVNRLAETYAKIERKNCRLNNDRAFYSNEFKKRFELALQIPEKDFIMDVLDLSVDEYEEAILAFSKQDNIEDLLKDYIQTREKKIHIKNMNDFITKNKEQLFYKQTLTNEKLYKVFLTVSTHKFSVNNKGISEPNQEFIRFILGDLKKDNDSLLRILLNNYGFGLEKTMDHIINKFNFVKQICDDSNGKLSIFNIIHLIDICKTIIYKLKPDEKDIAFNDLVNLINDTNFLKEPSSEVFKKALSLHKKRRTKIFSSIPIVEGDKNGIFFKTIEFDSPKLITIGVNNGTCFRVGALGEDFLEYSMLSPHSAVIELKDEKGNTYTCPIIRNGNGVYANGIDPKIPNELTRIKLMKALQEVGNVIINNSLPNEKIDFFAISNLNQIIELPNDNYYELDMSKYQRIEDYFHADYLMKHDETNHNDCRRVFAIAHTGTIIPQYYLAKSQFFQTREDLFIYDGSKECDTRKIEYLINYVYYSSIDFMSISEKEKMYNRSNFSELNPRDFSYIIGSKDWFIAIDHNGGIISERLNYDTRSLLEYKSALDLVASKVCGKVK